ncbi:MAG: hypothetical protein L6R40_005495 [Gallowayella cf. fulva]|nr:MAG: hypothetical protein L6R40_005495 [Xanthomendoza cf. fulva]
MLVMKAPGVSGSKINSITQLCNANIQSESVLIQKIYTHFKKAPGPYKLGVLYVVDSVTRSWVEQARKAGQQPSASAAYGTYGAGVYRVTELLPMLMTDISNSAPEDQKVRPPSYTLYTMKERVSGWFNTFDATHQVHWHLVMPAARIKKLIDIWERGNTFPNEMLSSFKEKVDAPSNDILSDSLLSSVGVKSTTPPGSPPKDFIPLTNGPEQPGKTAAIANGAPATDTSAILKALADMAKTNTGAPGTSAQGSSSNVTNFPNSFPQNMSAPVNQAPSVPPASQAVGVPGANAAPSFAGMSSASGNFPPNLSNQPPSMQVPATMPVQGNGAPAMTPEIQQQLQILRALQAQGVPQDQWASVLSVLMAQAGGAGAAVPNQQAAALQHGWQQAEGAYGDRSRDRNGFNEQSLQSPSGRFRSGRSRSRSPAAWGRRNASPPRRRDSPVYGEYGRDSHNNGFGRSDRGRAGNTYRQRSPDRNRRSISPRRSSNIESGLPPPGPKMVDYDPNLRPGTIKVLSRTLFVGGVTCSDDELREIFSQFGIVQTCIVNVDKRHAFVKMISRKDAQQARDGMERYKSPDMQLRTRWGVGFGPRDCSDYSTGISIVPIDRLTEADNKWMLNAEYGGSGGKPMDTGMVVEEPDIEIGAGVSSKDSNPNHSAIGVPPAIPNFGFQFPTLPNGMPMFPPGLMPPGPPGPS